jgi:Putative addiction module component
MNLQYISDNKGQTTGIFMPIQDWQYLKKKYKGLENEEQAFDIPEWHKAIIDQRLAAYKANPTDVIDFDKACDDIEKEL